MTKNLHRPPHLSIQNVKILQKPNKGDEVFTIPVSHTEINRIAQNVQKAHRKVKKYRIKHVCVSVICIHTCKHALLVK